MCENSPDIICSKRLRVHHENGIYEVVGTTEDSGRRSIVKSGVPPRRGVRYVGLYLIIQVSSGGFSNAFYWWYQRAPSEATTWPSRYLFEDPSQKYRYFGIPPFRFT